MKLSHVYANAALGPFFEKVMNICMDIIDATPPNERTQIPYEVIIKPVRNRVEQQVRDAQREAYCEGYKSARRRILALMPEDTPKNHKAREQTKWIYQCLNEQSDIDILAPTAARF